MELLVVRDLGVALLLTVLVVLAMLMTRLTRR